MRPLPARGLLSVRAPAGRGVPQSLFPRTADRGHPIPTPVIRPLTTPASSPDTCGGPTHPRSTLLWSAIPSLVLVSPSLPEATGPVIRLSDGPLLLPQGHAVPPWSVAVTRTRLTLPSRLSCGCNLPGWLGLPGGACGTFAPSFLSSDGHGAVHVPSRPDRQPCGRWAQRLTSWGPVSPATAATVHKDGVWPPMGVCRQAGIRSGGRHAPLKLNGEVLKTARREIRNL